MILSEHEKRALAIVVAWWHRGVLIRPGMLGAELWPDRRKTVLPAGRVLHRLKVLGLVRWTLLYQPKRWGWEPTEYGHHRQKVIASGSDG